MKTSPGLIIVTMNKSSKNPRIPLLAKPKKSKPKKQRPPQKKKVAKSKPEPQLELTACAAKYALAIANPWSNQAAGACVPIAPARPSRKVTAFLRGTFAVGVNGYGFIALSPTLQSNFASIWTSDAAYAGTTINATMVPTTGVNALTMPNLPYTREQLYTEEPAYFTTAVRGRIVSAAVSIKYIGTELNRGGRVVCYSTADHQSINGYTLSMLGAKSESDFSTPGYDREKCWVQTYGVSNEELEFCEAPPDVSASISRIMRSYPFSNGEALTSNPSDLDFGAPMLGALVYGVAGNLFEFEVVEHVEYIGDLAEAGYTENSADPRGLSLVQTAASRSQRSRSGKPEAFQKVFKRELLRAGTEVAKTAIAKGGMMLLSAL